MTRDANHRRGFPTGWEILGILLIVLLPARVYLGEQVWALGEELFPQVLIFGLAYAIAMVGLAMARWHGWRRTLLGMAAIAAAFAAAYGVQYLRPELSFSRGVFGLSFLLAIGLFVSGEYLRGRLRAGAAALMAAFVLYSTGSAAFVAGDEAAAAAAADAGSVIYTAYYPVRLTTHANVVSRADSKRGGGLERMGGGFLLATGSGALYEIAPQGDSLTSAKLAVAAPLNLEAFDAAAPPKASRYLFRAMDVITRETATGLEVMVSHHYWRDADACVAVRVSAITLDAALEPTSAGWRTVYETRPCLSIGDQDIRGKAFPGHELGGRMAWLDDGRLLVTTGDMGFDGWNREVAAAQRDDYDYGKTLLIDVASGASEVFTRGHRNPQGLYIDDDRRIWLTEHGPEGGDELNLLERGANYGWPYETYGTDYLAFEWPNIEPDRAGASFREPVFSWVPAIAVSNLIGLRGDAFARWHGDLLVGSLKAKSLFRIEVADDRVVYAEPIAVGTRVRDLVEDEAGRIWLWDDDARLTTLSLAERMSRGAAIFAACSQCHTAVNDRSGGLAPSLERILGRDVAALPDYDYSDGLRALDGQWTEERLDAYLEDPTVFAPGTTMTYEVPDPEDRRQLIEHLRRLQSRP